MPRVTPGTGGDPFERYRGDAESDETMPERMRRLRDEYPRRTRDERGESGGR